MSRAAYHTWRDGICWAGGRLWTTARPYAVPQSSMLFMCSRMSPPSGPRYFYTGDLWALHQQPRRVTPATPGVRSSHQLPTPSPLNPHLWDMALRRHPDRLFVEYVIQGLELGFRIGFDGMHPLRSASRNMASAYAAPQVVSDYLQAEVALGRILGPLSRPLNGLVVSKFGVIPKKHQVGKWRLILDLSSPEGASVNDGISKDLCSVKYPYFDQAAKLIMEAGVGALLSKIDIKHAYRIVPVHPEDWTLLGMQWQGQYFMDTHLPFGLRSAPKIFTAVADSLQWILIQQGVPTNIHYLDDFLFIEKLGTQSTALTHACALMGILGVPTAPHKVEGPSTRLTFLGIELDTTTLTARLPEDKLHRLTATLQAWGDRKQCLKQELLSLIGVLQHASAVVRFGRAFLRSMIELSKTVKALHHHIRLNREFWTDLQWWRAFTPTLNGRCFLLPALQAAPDEDVFTDASGSWGCDGMWRNEWFQFQWAPSWASTNITAKELTPIVLAAILWGHCWGGKAMRFRCDNQAIVHCIQAGSSKEPFVAQLLRGLFMLAACRDFHPVAVHIAGLDNGPADSLSRNALSLFTSQVPEASKHGTPIPPTVAALFQNPEMDWTSDSWRQQFLASWQRGSRPQLRARTGPENVTT